MSRAPLARALRAGICLGIATVATAATSPGAHAPRFHRHRGPDAPRSTAATGNVQYFGGHVISHVQVVPVNWGNNVAPAVATGAEAFYGTIVNSPYIDWMGEYDTVGLKGATDQGPGTNQHVNRGTVLKTVTITPSVTSNSITDDQIQTEIKSQIAAGKLPAPQVDPEGGVNTLYMLSFPPQVTINDGSGARMCQEWCAYHSTIQLDGVSAGVPYGIMPDFSQKCSQCGDGDTLSLYTQSASHELMEAISDAEAGLSNANSGRPLAWNDASNQSGEIGDLCENDQANYVPYMGFTVQKIWSQRLKSCITDDPSLTLCNGTTRPCKPCSASDCSGSTCDTDVTSPKFGQCVGCSDNRQCTSPGKSICDTTSGTCRGCAKDAECSGATPRCIAESGSCVACVADADCPNGGSCDTSAHTCGGGASSSSGGGSSSGNGGSSSGNGGGSSSGNGDDPGASSGGNSGPGASSSSGCSMAQTDAARPGGFAGLLLGLALLVARRRSRTA